ncbi:molybdenum cofactor biosynthesis protein MoaD [Rugosibacter aromaticivorans]|uniref:Molybdopterin synthase sulfur carrier subunit n=1 Tax=Rugosibacter aromaticivorans TaxID=1565605 RepID=A0A0C5J9G8_9PROT|nr:molybdopterin converting factor subunit 1 [Rugosibacter aromaticivorans]AJP48413.1 molybdenum cofactor biosynthesis protein MoaD [Rugosibacter aromaticivorans]TBR13307.1 MAG: molybdopterin converting factor subunit 1 [Rugosibacter sp.]
MHIHLLYFAGLREALGVTTETLVLPTGVDTVATLREFLAARGAPWTALVTIKNLRAAVNQQMAGQDTHIQAGDEVAFFPPVTGG